MIRFDLDTVKACA